MTPSEYLKILNEEHCNIDAVAERMGFTKQYASALVKHLKLRIKRIAVFDRPIRKRKKVKP